MNQLCPSSVFFFFNDTPTTDIYTLSLHDALPIFIPIHDPARAVLGVLQLINALDSRGRPVPFRPRESRRSEEHTSELQSLRHLVCRLLLEKKKKKNN